MGEVGGSVTGKDFTCAATASSSTRISDKADKEPSLETALNAEDALLLWNLGLSQNATVGGVGDESQNESWLRVEVVSLAYS